MSNVAGRSDSAVHGPVRRCAVIELVIVVRADPGHGSALQLIIQLSKDVNALESQKLEIEDIKDEMEKNQKEVNNKIDKINEKLDILLKGKVPE